MDSSESAEISVSPNAANPIQQLANNPYQAFQTRSAARRYLVCGMLFWGFWLASSIFRLEHVLGLELLATLAMIISLFFYYPQLRRNKELRAKMLSDLAPEARISRQDWGRAINTAACAVGNLPNAFIVVQGLFVIWGVPLFMYSVIHR